MKKYFGVFCIFIFLLVALAQKTFASEYKILVLPDNIQFNNTNYLIFPDASVIFASDVINQLKMSGRIDPVSMYDVRDALQKSKPIRELTYSAAKEYKYNYNVSFVKLKPLAKYFKTNKILLITSQTDTQNYFLRRTFWDFLNVPGATVIDAAYRLSTFATLVDVEQEKVIWQCTFYKKLSARENRIIALTFAPATEQLKIIKSYSMYWLSPAISTAIQNKILPTYVPVSSPNQDIVNVNTTVDFDSLKYKAKNIKNLVNKAPKITEDDLKNPVQLKKQPNPKMQNNDYGIIINEL